jgi:hypothetical protein
MARKFKLTEKPCTLGNKFTSNGEGEGDKREDLVKFSLEGLMLTAKELLPLNEGEDDDDEQEDGAKPKSKRNGTQPAAH